MNFRKSVRNGYKKLRHRLSSRHQPHEQEQSSACCEEPGPSPANLRTEPPAIKLMASSERLGQLSGATSTPSLVETWRGGEVLHGRLEVPTPVGPKAGSWSSSSRGGHLQTGNGGSFSGAHHFTVDQVNAIEIQSIGSQGVRMQNVATQNINNRISTNSLKDMLPYVIPGAEYNSAARDPPPKCHPETRIQIRQDLHNRIEGATRLIWIHGPAGVGKSAIMQTIAETVPTCATLFFSCSSDPPRNDSRKVFTTLAYNLAVANDGYYRYIEGRLSKDPFFLEKSLAEQFHRLFIAPFIDNLVKAGRQQWVVLLDGLDECKNEQNDQCRIVDLIGDSILRHAGATPFIRPEDHLMTALRRLKGNFQDRPAEFWERGIPVDSDDAVQDIERYLHVEFTKIREENPRSFPNPTSPWPSDGDFLKVAKASSGLFVFASTVTKYVSVDRPVSRLKLIVTLIDQSTLHPTSISQKPFSLLDLLYTQIMSDIPKDLVPIAKSLLGYYRLISMRSINAENGLVYVCNVLGLCQDEAYDALRKLHSVLTCPPPEAAENQGIKYFHASFADFLFDHSRSQEYHVNLDQELTTIWRCSIRILKEFYRANAIVPTSNHRSVNIQWVPWDDDSCLDELCKNILGLAHHICLSLLIEYGHSWCTSCPLSNDGMRLLVDAPETIDILRSICPDVFYADTSLMNQFLSWLDHAPKAIQETVISQKSPISQLDTKRLFRSLHARPQCCYVASGATGHIDIIVAGQDDDAFQWSHVKGELQVWGEIHSFDLMEVVEAVNMETSRECMIRVVGVEPSGLCVVIGPFPARFTLSGDAFYVLPYSEV